MVYKMAISNRAKMQEILRTIIGSGKNLKSGTNQEYEKGDVMKYVDSSGKWHLYVCKNAGTYSIPDDQNFKPINLRS